MLGVRRLATCRRRDHLLLARDDHEEDIGGHDCAEHGTEVQVSPSPAEQLAQPPGQQAAAEEQYESEQPGVARERRPAEQVIDDPAADDKPDGDGHGLPWREICDARVDQVDTGAVPVDQRGQQDARQPGRVCLPFEPVEGARQRRWRHPVFLGVIEATAMHGPDFPTHSLAVIGGIRGRAQVVVEPIHAMPAITCSQRTSRFSHSTAYAPMSGP